MPKIKPHVSIKHALIDKTNAVIVISISVAVFVAIFSIFSVKALVSQSLYQKRVVVAKKEALQILQNNFKTANILKASYTEFNLKETNILGEGSVGNNAKIVLDALPSVYDYPALSSSIEKILVSGSYQIQSIGGSEKNVQVGDSPSSEPIVSDSAPIEISYPISITATPERTLALLKTLESSIRPFYVTSLSISSGGGGKIDTSIGLKTFYKTGTGIEITSKVVK